MRKRKPKLIMYEYMLFFANYGVILTDEEIEKYNDGNCEYNDIVLKAIKKLQN